MTNAEIIFNNRVFLAEQGVIKTDEDGMPEEIHTFDAWKKRGYIVKKGEHAVAKFQIWMPSKKSKKQMAEEEQEQEREQKDPTAMPRMFKKVACFFTAEQVTPITAS